MIKFNIKNVTSSAQDQFYISWLRDSLCEIHERPHRQFSSCYDYHLERRVLFWFILKVEIDSLRSDSAILLFRMWSLFARMLLPTLVLFVLVIVKFSCLEVSSCWKFKAIHSVSGEFLLYSLWSNNACLYTIICSGRARLHSKWIFIKDCILTLQKNYNQVGTGDNWYVYTSLLALACLCCLQIRFVLDTTFLKTFLLIHQTKPTKYYAFKELHKNHCC